MLCIPLKIYSLYLTTAVLLSAFWGPFAFYYVARSVLAKLMLSYGMTTIIFAAIIVQSVLFTPMIALFGGEQIPSILPWWLVLSLEPREMAFSWKIGGLFFILFVAIAAYLGLRRFPK